MARKAAPEEAADFREAQERLDAEEAREMLEEAENENFFH